MKISHKFLPKLFPLLTPSRRGDAGDKIYEHIFRSLRIVPSPRLRGGGVIFMHQYSTREPPKSKKKKKTGKMLKFMAYERFYVRLSVICFRN